MLFFPDTIKINKVHNKKLITMTKPGKRKPSKSVKNIQDDTAEFKKKTTVGIRIPDNSIALEIVRQLGNPIVSTSIHDEDEVIEYTTDPELIFEKWQNLVDLVIDGGYGDNIGSTIIDLSGDEPMVVREGKGSLDIL